MGLARSEKAAGKQPAGQAAAAAPATELSLKDRLDQIPDDELREIVRLFVTPGTKHNLYYAGGVRLSPVLRKLYAQYSFGLDSRGAPRGLNPTIRVVRKAVEDMGCRWPHRNSPIHKQQKS